MTDRHRPPQGPADGPTRTPARLNALLIGGYLLLLAGIIAAPSGRSTAIGPVDRPQLDGLLQAYWAGCGALWLMLGAIAWRLGRGGPSRRTVPLATFILATALLARVGIVFTTYPQLSDDLWRYIHDGTTLGVHGVNPYRHSPARAGVGALVNHPDLVTIYQPASQWVFAGLARLSAALFDGPPPLTATAAHRVFRLGFVLFDMLVLAVLLRRLASERRSLWWSVLWAWHPLVLSEVAAAGHQDVIGIACTMLALHLLAGNGPCHGSIARATAGGWALGLAIAVKPIVAPLVLPAAWSMRNQPRSLTAAGASLALALAALYLPFALMPGGLAGMWRTTLRFVDAWAFNSSIHGPLLAVTGSKLAAAILTGGTLAAVLLFCTLRGRDLWRTGLAFLLAGLLLSSTAHPWYLLWALALVPLRFNGAAWVWSLTITWSYVALMRPTFTVPPAVLAFEYAPVYAALAWALARRMHRRRSGHGASRRPEAEAPASARA